MKDFEYRVSRRSLPILFLYAKRLSLKSNQQNLVQYISDIFSLSFAYFHWPILLTNPAWHQQLQVIRLQLWKMLEFATCKWQNSSQRSSRYNQLRTVRMTESKKLIFKKAVDFVLRPEASWGDDQGRYCIRWLQITPSFYWRGCTSTTWCTVLLLEENVSLCLLEPLETIMSAAKQVSLLKHQISLRNAARSSSVASRTGQCGLHSATKPTW